MSWCLWHGLQPLRVAYVCTGYYHHHYIEAQLYKSSASNWGQMTLQTKGDNTGADTVHAVWLVSLHQWIDHPETNNKIVLSKCTVLVCVSLGVRACVCAVVCINLRRETCKPCLPMHPPPTPTKNKNNHITLQNNWSLLTENISDSLTSAQTLDPEVTEWLPKWTIFNETSHSGSWDWKQSWVLYWHVVILNELHHSRAEDQMWGWTALFVQSNLAIDRLICCDLAH